MDLGNWRDFFSSKIYKRGERYYEEGDVSDLKCTEKQITADVYGSDIYEVTIDLDDGRVEEMDCTCPYAEKGEYCKHMVAYCWPPKMKSWMKRLLLAREKRRGRIFYKSCLNRICATSSFS